MDWRREKGRSLGICSRGERERGSSSKKARKSVREWWAQWIDFQIPYSVCLQHLITFTTTP